MRRLFLFLAIFFLLYLVTPSRATNYPKSVGYVNDFANLFSSDFRTRLESQLQQLNSDTTNQLVVVTVDNLEGIPLEEYTNTLFTQWGIGQKGKDNGLLLLIAKQERQIRIEVGYGLESVITDGRAGEIIRQSITPAFKRSDFQGGTQAGVDSLIAYVTGNTPTEGTSQNSNTSPDFGFLIPLIVFVVYLFSFFARTREVVLGAIVGALLGFIAGGLFWAIICGIIGLILDLILSRNYKKYQSSGLPTGFWSSRGGFFSSGGGKGWGGGFGGGSSGGGGASGSW